MAKQVLLWLGGDRILSHNTVAAMLADANANGQDVLTRGYNSVDDCGWNLYRYDSGSSATIDGGHVLPGIGGTMALGSDGLWDAGSGVAGTGRYLAYDCTYDPAKFGADVTGTTDTAKYWLAVNAVLPDDGTIEPTPGTYLVSNAITIDTPCKLICKSVKLVRDADLAVMLTFTGGGSDGNTTVVGLEIDGGRLDASAPTWTSDGKIIYATGNRFTMENCYIHDGVETQSLSLGLYAYARFNYIHHCHFADCGRWNLRMGGEYNEVDHVISENTTHVAAVNGFRHLSIRSQEGQYADAVYRWSNMSIINDTADANAMVGQFDTGAQPAPYLFEMENITIDWRDSLYDNADGGVSSLIKIATGRTFRFKNIVHLGDSVNDNSSFLNIASGTDVILEDVYSVGNLYINAAVNLYTTRCKFGFKSDGTASVILGCANGPSTEIPTLWVINDCEWQGVTGNPFNNATPTTNQRIIYDALKIRANSASHLYFASNVTSTHHYVGTRLDFEVSGGGNPYLANTAAKRVMLSRTSSDPKKLVYGLYTYRSPDLSVTTGYVSGTNAVMPAPDGGTDKFPGVTGFLGDIIENHDYANNGYNEQGWMHDGTQWINRG